MQSWKIRLLIVSVPCFLWGLFYLYNIFFPWTRLWCSESEIDIRSGRVRHANYRFYFSCNERIRDTPLTKALAPEELAGVKPDWRRVSTLSLGTGNSPHYRFHGADFDTEHLKLIWERYQLDAAARRETARTVLRLWQENGRDAEAGYYLLGLEPLLDANQSNGPPEHSGVSVEDLPSSIKAIEVGRPK